METADNTEVIEAEGIVSDFKPENETKVVKYSVTMAQIAKLQEEYKEVPKDLTIKANYELVRKAASHLRTLRTDVEKRRKELKADALAWGKLVDGTAKEITEKLLAIEEPFAAAKKEFDTAAEIAKREAALAEEKRVDGIAERIAGIKALVSVHVSSSSETIQKILNELNIIGLTVPSWAMEFADKADETLKDTIGKLAELHALKLQQETFAAEQAAAEEARKIKEEEDRKQREKEVEEERAKLAAEREAMEAEKVRLAAEQKIKDDAAAEAERKRNEAYEAERKRLADEQAEKDRLQKEKDDAAAAEMAKIKAEMDALRKAQEKPVVEDTTPQSWSSQDVEKEAPAANVAATTPPVEAQAGAEPSEPTTYAEDYRAAGNAMLKYIGNKAYTKALLDAIINNEVPNIQFTGVITK